MMMLQRIIQTGKKIIPRGWSLLLRFISRFYPRARMYPALLNNGDTLYIDLSENMCHGYFYYGEVSDEQYTDAFFKKVLGEGDTFLDVGANIGYYTRLASKLVGKRGIVHAFEPNPAAIRLLEKNTRNLSNVHLHETAVSDAEGICDFSVNKYGETSAIGLNPAAKYVVRVRQNSLDNLFLDEARIDVIKIDVEGFEKEVLFGAKDIIGKHHPLLYFEYISIYASNRGFRFADFKSLLEPWGYSLAWININYPNGSLISEDPSSRYIIGLPKNSRWQFLN